MAQSVEVVEQFKEVQNSSVIAAYSSEFASEIREYGDTETGDFKFVVIRMNLEGDAAEAKHRVTLYCPTQKLVKTYKERPNQMLFLFPYEAKTIYVECGDGCEKKLLADGKRLKYNTVYEATVKYIPSDKVLQSNTSVFINYNKKTDAIKYRIHENEEQNFSYTDVKTDSLKLRLYTTYQFVFSRMGFADTIISYNIDENVKSIEFPKLREIYGVLSVESVPNKATVTLYSNSTEGVSTYHTPIKDMKLRVGDYRALISKKHYMNSSTMNIAIRENELTTLPKIKLKEIPHFRTFILLNAAYSPSNQWSGGFMVGMVKHAGWYVKFRSSFDFAHISDVVGTCNKNGQTEGGGIPIFSGKVSKPHFIVTGGAAVRLGCNLNALIGVGYGQRRTLWQVKAEESEGKQYWCKVNDYSYQGVAAEIGLLYNTTSHVSVSVSVSTIVFKYVDFEIGIGYVF
ncbi:MAG: hypothetical protein MJ009_03925 [Paludibacteraceae bacterium]|nr:hypothetical protein [Paludibacteraceae bacterium]